MTTLDKFVASLTEEQRKDLTTIVSFVLTLDKGASWAFLRGVKRRLEK